MCQLELKSDHGVLLTESGEAVALLNKRTFEALSSAASIDEQEFEVEAWITLADWDSKLSERRNLSKNNRKVIRIQADLLLYGPGNDQSKEHVATTLGNYRTYLQDPHTEALRAPYLNPQSLEIPAEIASATATAYQWASMEAEAEDDAEDNTEGTQGQLSDLIVDFETFLEQVPTRRSEVTVRKDTRIITPLLRYFELYHRKVLWN